MKNKHWQIPAPVASESEFKVSKDSTFRLKVSNASEAFRLLKFLFTKFFARGEVLNTDEEILLELLLEYFRSLRNLSISRNILNKLELLALLNLGRHYTEFRKSELPVWVKNQIAIFAKNRYFLSPRAFLGEQKVFKVSSFIRRKNRRLAQKPPPERFIGVGYRDKGTASVSSIDGTPSWKTVAGKITQNPFEEETRESLLSVPFRILTRNCLIAD